MPEQPTKDTRNNPKPSPGLAELPLDEVVMGVQFDPLLNFSTAHIGAFWQKIRDRYPNVEDSAPLPHQKEKADLTTPQTETVFRFSGIPHARCMFLFADKTQLVQLQKDQFYRNWRRFVGNEIYPHYEYLRKEFTHEWETFKQFAQQEVLITPNVNQCELSYVNQVLKGSGWDTFADCHRFFTIFSPVPKSGVLANPEIENWSGNYKLPNDRGRLYIEIGPAFRGRDFKMILGFTLRIRGVPESSNTKDLLAWFDLAHEWAVKAFLEITTPEIQELWKKHK